MRLRPELTGKALAEFIIAFKNSAPDFEDHLLASTTEEIERRILAFRLGGDSAADRTRRD